MRLIVFFPGTRSSGLIIGEAFGENYATDSIQVLFPAAGLKVIPTQAIGGSTDTAGW